VKRIVQNSGIHLLLLLYCFALFSFSTSQAAQIDQQKSSDINDECRSSLATSFQVYSNQLDLQLKTFSEKKDNSFHKKNLEKLLFSCGSDQSLEISQYKVKGPKDIICRCFSQTDIIYPFHSFW
jgi:hypothetical protein